MSSLPGTMPSASGYRSLGVLNSPVFAKSLVTRFYCEAVSGNITDQSIVPTELKQSGDTVIFRRDPKPEIFDYVKNQDLSVSELNTDPITMVVKRAKYWNLKLDQVDLKQITNIREFVDKFQANAVQEMAQRVDKEVLAHIPAEADCFNKGANAGKNSRGYNLGFAGAAVALNTNTLMQVMSYVMGTLAEQCASGAGETYIVLPQQAKTLFFNNPILTSALLSGNSKSIVLGGTVPASIMGINIYFSPNVLTHTEGSGVAYSIPFGHKTATGFVTQLMKQQEIKDDPRSFSEYWRALSLYDFKVIRPELVGNLYATITI